MADKKKPNNVAKIGKHTPTITQEEFTQKLEKLEEDFENWMETTLTILDTQRKNLWRPDNFCSTFDALINDSVAVLVAKAQRAESNLWAFSLTKKVLTHIENDLNKIEEILRSYSVAKMMDIAQGNAEDELFGMVVYMDKNNMTLDDAWWEALTYNTVRPYGEKFNDAMRQFMEQRNELLAQLPKEEGADE